MIYKKLITVIIAKISLYSERLQYCIF